MNLLQRILLEYFQKVVFPPHIQANMKKTMQATKMVVKINN